MISQMLSGGHTVLMPSRCYLDTMKTKKKISRQQIANPFYGVSYIDRLKKSNCEDLSDGFIVEETGQGFSRILSKTGRKFNQDSEEKDEK